jgi:phosphohistidine phosphatase
LRIVLVRHGKAEPHAASDAARALTHRGHEQARAAARWLRETLAQCDGLRLLASPYRRAQETAAPIADALGVAVHTVAEITPDDDPRRALAAVEAAGKGAGTLVVVSHMPLVAGLAGWLQEGVLNAGRGFDLAEVRVLEVEMLAPGLAREAAVYVPGLEGR